MPVGFEKNDEKNSIQTIIAAARPINICTGFATDRITETGFFRFCRMMTRTRARHIAASCMTKVSFVACMRPRNIPAETAQGRRLL